MKEYMSLCMVCVSMYLKESFMDVAQDASLVIQDTFSLVYVSYM